MKEVWKDIEGYEGLYQVSNFGNVKSINYARRGYSKVLTPKKNNSGRLWVELAKNHQTKPMLIHRLVAKAFVDNPNGLPQVNHIDEDPTNNMANNLEWCTSLDNNRLYAEHNKGRTRKRKLEKPVLQMDLLGNVIQKWENAREITVITGMNQWSITQCCIGTRKQAYGFKWQYAV